MVTLKTRRAYWWAKAYGSNTLLGGQTERLLGREQRLFSLSWKSQLLWGKGNSNPDAGSDYSCRLIQSYLLEVLLMPPQSYWHKILSSCFILFYSAFLWCFFLTSEHGHPCPWRPVFEFTLVQRKSFWKLVCPSWSVGDLDFVRCRIIWGFNTSFFILKSMETTKTCVTK